MTPPRLIPTHTIGSDNTDIHAPLLVRGLTVAYDDKPALWDLDYKAPERGLVAVVGPNGAGKSTMIKAILGLVPRLSGNVSVFGQPSRRARRRIAYVPQRTAVDWDFPASAVDVVTMGLYGKIGWGRPVRRRHRETAYTYLDRVGMADFGNRQIGQLSGGQQQRVFLARALAQEANLYLMDEPFSGVDAATERAIVEVMHEVRANGATVICVHHDLQTVSDYFDHALVLNVRRVAAGRIRDILTEEVLQAAYGGRLAPTELRAAVNAS